MGSIVNGTSTKINYSHQFSHHHFYLISDRRMITNSCSKNYGSKSHFTELSKAITERSLIHTEIKHIIINILKLEPLQPLNVDICNHL